MKLYVACLAAYNAGRLHGAWIDASDDTAEMQDAINTMLRGSPCPDAEEWAIHDYDGFPNMGEYPGLAAVAAMAGLIEMAKDDHRIDYDDFQPIAANWHGVVSDIEHALEAFAGTYDTLRTYADELADEALDADGVKEGSFAQRHFDYESHASDIEIEYTIIDCPSGVAVFWPH